MWAKTKIAGLMTALMALSVPMVYADNGPEDGKSMHQEGDWHHKQEHIMFKVLNLSEDQEKQFRDIKQKQKAAMKNTFEQMETNREAFEAEIMKAAADMNKINDLQSQLKTIQGQMVDNRFNSLLEIKKVLTPEQFAGYMALEKAEDLMEHKDRGKWGHEDRAGKDKDDDKK